MKITIYQPRASYFVGGGETIPIQQAIHLSKIGHEVTFVTTRAEFLVQTEIFKQLLACPRIKVVYIDIPTGLKWIYNQEPGVDWSRWHQESLHVGLLARELLATIASDIIVTHYLLDHIAIPLGRKNVLHLHGYPPEFEYYQYLFATLPSVCISVSKIVADKWRHLFSTEGYYVSENGIDSDIFVPITMGYKYDLLYVGRLIPVKGVDVLLESISQLDRKVKVGIAGRGPSETMLHELVSKLGIQDRVEFLGYVPEGDKVRLYNSARIVVAPSRDREGILTTVLEATSYGRPVIVSSAGGITELIRHGYNGLVVTPDNPAELTKSVANLLDNPEYCNKLGMNGRLIILDSWSWDKKIRQLVEIYDEIANTEGGAI